MKPLDHPKFWVAGNKLKRLGSFDVVRFIIDLEAGNLDDDKVIEGFQHLIDSDVVWDLQGSYGRTAHALIQAGKCHAKADPAVLAHVQKQRAACGSNCSE